jgi:hypothetical protein
MTRNIIDNTGMYSVKDTANSLTINSSTVTINGQFFVSGSTSGSVSLATQLNPTWIPDPGANRNADTTALVLFTAGEAISAWAPTVTRTIDVANAPSSMGFTIVKVNTTTAGLQISGSGWSGNGLLFGSDQAVSGSWLVRLDLPNRIIISTPGV